MLAVRNLAHRVYYQCLFVFVMIKVPLIAVVSVDPCRYYVPVRLVSRLRRCHYLPARVRRDAYVHPRRVHKIFACCRRDPLGIATGFLFGVNDPWLPQRSRSRPPSNLPIAYYNPRSPPALDETLLDVCCVSKWVVRKQEPLTVWRSARATGTAARRTTPTPRRATSWTRRGRGH